MMVWICEDIISPTVHCMGADLQCYVCQILLGFDLALSPMNVSFVVQSMFLVCNCDIDNRYI
jgi:hypothetical protein